MFRFRIYLSGLFAALLTLNACSDSPVAAVVDNAFERIRAEAEALGGAAFVIDGNEDMVLDIDDESSPLAGMRVAVPAGALPEGVKDAVLSIVPVKAPAAAAFRPYADAVTEDDVERVAYVIRMQTAAGVDIDELAKSLTIFERLNEERRTLVQNALRMTNPRDDMCTLLDLAAKLAETERSIEETEEELAKRQAQESATQEKLEQQKQERQEQQGDLLNKLEQQKQDQRQQLQKESIEDPDKRAEIERRLAMDAELRTRLEQQRKGTSTVGTSVGYNTAGTTATGAAVECETLDSEEVLEAFLQTFVPSLVIETSSLGTLKPVIEKSDMTRSFFAQSMVYGDGVTCDTTSFEKVSAHYVVDGGDGLFTVWLNTDEPGMETTFQVSLPQRAPLTDGETLVLDKTAESIAPGFSNNAACPGDEPFDWDWENADFQLTLSDWKASAVDEDATCTFSGSCRRTTGSLRVSLWLDAPFYQGLGAVEVHLDHVVDGFFWEEANPIE